MTRLKCGGQRHFGGVSSLLPPLRGPGDLTQIARLVWQVPPPAEPSHQSCRKGDSTRNFPLSMTLWRRSGDRDHETPR